MKISVCLASYNGQLFIEQQIKSILAQLSEYDELIVSDDCSTDKTLEIVETLNDKRIKIFSGIRYGSPIRNFENALKHATGDVIFLSDQDDVWLPNKVKIMTSYFHQYDVVVSNCSIVAKELNIIKDSFFLSVNTRKGFFNNLYDNHYLGCCMAFKKKVLDIILPFPKKIAMHDIWIGLCAEAFYKSIFVDDVLLLYRRHGGNASPTSERSSACLLTKLWYRFYFLIQVGYRMLLWRR